MNQVSLTIDSRPENVPLVGACAKELAGDLFSAEKLSEIEQALTEAVNNCIEHAYCGSEEFQIIIKYVLSNDCLLIEITDQGKQFDADYLKNLNTEFNYDPYNIDDLPEGGFGLKVIKTYMDEVDYRRENGKNYWLLKKYSSAAPN
jgi:serine/threonine-protein kinase RsbW